MREEIRRENPTANDWDLAFMVNARLNGFATSTGHSATYGVINREVEAGRLPANPNPIPEATGI